MVPNATHKNRLRLIFSKKGLDFLRKGKTQKKGFFFNKGFGLRNPGARLEAETGAGRVGNRQVSPSKSPNNLAGRRRSRAAK